MKSVSRTVTGWICCFEELTPTVKKMFYAAGKVRKNAQAPYSHFLVGVAGQSAKTGAIYRGCNVERASLTQTSHAEQVMLDSMVTAEGKGAPLLRLVLLAGPEDMDIVLPPIVVEKSDIGEINFSEIPSPCGHCLQCIWENCLGYNDIEIYGLLPTGHVTVITIDNAFPLKFGPADLGVKY